ncbi:hypothetical protein D6T63_18465 [Arthrobacter cheniae]|uniref:N-acetyltransferase domain-containing protein n=1 Tax=Arthrobacter cheniae TaxID=1258888 RepID=A0A3A5LYT2_9MICC|nr:N-acetyltransferase [Arthrobacter cheniae]RJT74896.1 hypothetical protein D6T63_18465 [Arthrobacter cheniae]
MTADPYSVAPLRPSPYPHSVSVLEALDDHEDVGVGFGSAPEIPADLAAESTRDLRVLATLLYKELDTEAPPFGTYEDYLAVSEELDRRVTPAIRVMSDSRPMGLRDNTVRSRFELFDDGEVVGSIAYTLRSGRLTLRNTVLAPEYEEQDSAFALIRGTLLNAHRRRLAVVPYCPHIQTFLDAHPAFKPLVSSS